METSLGWKQMAVMLIPIGFLIPVYSCQSLSLSDPFLTYKLKNLDYTSMQAFQVPSFLPPEFTIRHISSIVSRWKGLPWWFRWFLQCRNMGSILESGRSPGEGNDNPLQYSCLENSMDRGTWHPRVHGVAENQVRLTLSLHFTLKYTTTNSNFSWEKHGRQEGFFLWEFILFFLPKEVRH